MSPRKRLRASPSDGVTPSSASSAAPTLPPSQASLAPRASDASADSAMARSPANSVASSVAEGTSNASPYGSLKDSKTKTRSWYGSWPRAPKSAALTQVARETILGGTSKPNAIPDFSRFDTRKTGEEGSSDSLEANGSLLTRKGSTLTVGGAKSNGSVSRQESEQAGSQMTSSTASNPKTSQPKSTGEPETTTEAVDTTAVSAGTEARPEGETAAEDMDTTQDEGTPTTVSAPTAAPGWFSWIGRKEAADPKPPMPEVTVSEAPELPKTEDSQVPTPPHEEIPQDTPVPATTERPTTSGGMWTYFWPGGSRTAQITGETEEATIAGEANPKNSNAPAADAPQNTPEDVVMEDAPSAPIPVPTASSALSSTRGTTDASAPATATASVGSTWAFWSRDARKTTGKSPESVEQGEIAVIGDRSEAHPKPAAGVKLNEQPSSKASSMKDVPVKDTTPKEAAKSTAAAPAKKSKRLRPKSMEIDDIAPLSPSTPLPEVLVPTKSGESTPAKQQATPAKGQQAPLKPPPANLLLPSFKSTYHLKENPSILRQIAQLLLRTQQAPANHVFLAKDLPKVKKAVAIGVHGLFPAAYLRPMIGQPTGTSIRFANHGAEAVRRWADSNGYQDCEIEKIALEGEGKIADRVENLWKLLLNWIDHIRGADLIVLACHSQGVPVGFMLLAKLIDLGIVTTARIGVCAMAGVSLGPFPDYKSGLGILMGSASELWDFANPESDVSKRYEHALKTALDYGVRVTFVGSIDDQVVPLESAIYSPVHHPYVYRAVFVDGRIHAPDFIANLIGFACKLRNLGVSDHGLVRELSVPLAGSLYSGEGHSRLYDEPQVYDLAISHALETADVAKAVCEITKHEGLANPNPYHLPWVMRGLLEEDFVKTELHAETAELVKQFDDWKPVTKALKDVKYRLEAVRSKL